MSEVKRYEFVYGNDFGNEHPAFPRLEVDGDYVEFADFDRVTAELKEGIAKHWKVVCDQRAKIDTLQQRLTAADERADVLDGLLREWLIDFGRTHSGLQRLKDRTKAELRKIDAALKPAEGGGDE